MKHSTILTLIVLAAICFSRLASAVATHADDLVGTSVGNDFLLDPAFGDAGSARLSCDGASSYAPARVVSDATGYWLLGSRLPYLGAGYEQFAAVRLDADGTLDATFGDAGCLVAWPPLVVISDAALGYDGRFYATGALTEPNDALIAAVTCFEADGSQCAGFGQYDGIAVVDGFDLRQVPRLLFRDGSLFVVGATALSSSGRADTVLIAKLDAETAAPDAGFGTGSPAPGEAIFVLGQYPGGSITTDAVRFDGSRILVGGAAQSTEEGGTVGYVLALDATDGSAGADFGENGVATIAFGSGADRVQAKALAVRADGRIAVAGNADLDGGVGPLRELMLAELEADGRLSADFAGGGSTHVMIGHETDVKDLALRGDGSLVVAMTTLGLLPDGVSDSNQQSVAEFDGDGAGPTATASIEFDGEAPPTSSASFAGALDIDDDGRVVLAGTHFCGQFGRSAQIVLCTEMTATRFVRDVIFASAFD
jgi:hypothetical protein